MKEITVGTYRREFKSELESPAIQEAIDACARAGGGVVHLLPGTYRCGTIHMRSHVTLNLQRGAVIVGSNTLADYPAPQTPFVDAVGQTRGRSLIAADDAHDFRIIGQGVIDGNGGTFHSSLPDHLLRPFLVRLVNCSKVELNGPTFRNPAAWTIHLLNCEDATIEKITIDSRANHNNDGIDIDSSRRITVRHCEIFSDDDSICLKATRREPCEDIEVHDCVLGTECGALKLGTESYGDIRRVRMRDCRVLYAATGAIKILSSDGGVFEDIEIRNIEIERSTGPIFIRLGHRGRTYAPGDSPKGPGAIRRVQLSGIRANVFVPPKEILIPATDITMPADAFSGLLVTGIPNHCVEDLTLEDCEIQFTGGFSGDYEKLSPPNQADMYPEHFYFGALPGSAAFLRHVRDVQLREVKFELQTADSRPLLVTEDVENMTTELKSMSLKAN